MSTRNLPFGENVRILFGVNQNYIDEKYMQTLG